MIPTSRPIRAGLFGAMLLAGAAFRSAQTPVPALTWQPWSLVGDCNAGVSYEVAVSQYDGRNDVQLKLRIRNTTSHLAATRFELQAASDDGQAVIRSGGTRIQPGGQYEGNPFYIGKLFETPVNALLPPRLSTLTFLVLETADVTKLPPYATPSTYLNDFRDFPKQTCRNLTMPLAGGRNAPLFMRLTDACYRHLPPWTNLCQEAVDALLAEAKGASERQIPCLQEWRRFQKCYEAYAFESRPATRPDCLQILPRCNYP